MELLKLTGIIAVMFILGVMAIATNSNAVQITSEDFEGGASGWNDNRTTVSGNASFTEFLGRNAGSGPPGTSPLNEMIDNWKKLLRLTHSEQDI